MKRFFNILLVSLLVLSLALTAAMAEGDHRVAKDGAQIQTDDPTMPTRVPMEGGTKILLHFGDTVIPGVLNDSETAQALIAKLPYTQHMSRYSHDFCGVTEDLPYNADEEHYGWLNGDIDYAIDEENGMCTLDITFNGNMRNLTIETNRITTAHRAS